MEIDSAQATKFIHRYYYNKYRLHLVSSVYADGLATQENK